MSYSVQNIRNVCLLGHSGSGKTSLAESLLFMTGAIDRMGRVADGNTVCDYDPEEVKRQISLSTAVAPIDYKGCRINVLDTPGAFDFSGEVMEALRAADAAIIDLLMAGAMVGEGTSYPDLKVTDQKLSSEEYGVGFLLGNTELRDAVNAELLKMAEDGTMLEIAQNYVDQGLVLDSLCLIKK